MISQLSQTRVVLYVSKLGMFGYDAHTVHAQYTHCTHSVHTHSTHTQYTHTVHTHITHTVHTQYDAFVGYEVYIRR